MIGAGPAGAQAAIVAAEQGCAVILLDEHPAAGGQVWRAPVAPFRGKGDVEARSGDALRRRLASSPVRVLSAHSVWSVLSEGLESGEGFRVDALGQGGNQTFTAPMLVVATGAHERVVPFPGWTLPGVIGLAAATVLLKSHGVAPGSRVVVAGCGPLLAAVSAGLGHTGINLLAVADMAPMRDWLSRGVAIATRPALAARGAWWVTRALAGGARYLPAHGVRRAEGVHSVNKVVLGPVGKDGAQVGGAELAFDVDTLIVGHGLTTQCDITRLLRARHRFDPLRGGWVPEINADFETSVSGLFAIGDGAGVRGQQIASLVGEKLGWVLSERLGRTSAKQLRPRAEGLDRLIAKAAPFSDAMSGLMAQRPAQIAAIDDATVVCRCEDVTRAEIDGAVDQGATSIDQLKHFTRCGMGPCQGRYCGDTVQTLMALRLQRPREQIGQWTGRPPLRPMPLGQMLGEFRYDDIPIPPPAPL